jgi:arylsulfatase
MDNQGTPNMGNFGRFRGELGEVTEGSLRTFCFVRWTGQVKPGTSSYAMFSIMDFMPTFAKIIGAKVPSDRPIDGVDQTDVLFGKSKTGNRDSLLTFIGADLVAARWKQWRVYFTDVHPTGIGPQRQPGMFSASAPMAGYPKVYNIEMDPHEDLQVGALFGWTAGPAPEVVEKYLESVKKYPNPPVPNITQFRTGGGGSDGGDSPRLGEKLSAQGQPERIARDRAMNEERERCNSHASSMTADSGSAAQQRSWFSP